MRAAYLALLSVFLGSCGGSGGGGGAPVTNTIAGVDCSEPGQRNWLRSFVDQHYLFYADSPQIAAASYTGTVADYFLDITRRGVPLKDKFSFTITVGQADSYLNSGTSAGIGAELFRDDQGRLRVGYVEPNSPALLAGVQRGDHILTINGEAVGSSMSSAQSSLIYASAPGTAVALEVVFPLGTASRTIPMQSALVQRAPVALTKVINPGTNNAVGYMVFNEHLFTAQNALAAAFAQLRDANVVDLVLDLRYNQGGSLALAAQAAHMISGKPYSTVFERLIHNDKQTASNFDLGFLDCYLDSNYYCVGALPKLNLNRVYVLTTGDTCSASESIINGLRGVDVEVVQLGGTTCGKPYGFYQTNRCDAAYFAVEFEGVNAKGQGGFVDGFTPQCSRADDFEHALGDETESLLATALSYRSSGACPATTAMAQSFSAAKGFSIQSKVSERPERGWRVMP